MRKLAGVVLLLLGATTAIVHGRQVRYKLIIPKVLTYPTTTLAFSSKAVLAGSDTKAPVNIKAKFDDPNWEASVSMVHWVTTGGGTFFKFTCAASSVSCKQATKGTGIYTYALTPTTQPAPMGYGHYSLIWDVNPPGDIVADSFSGVPEIDAATGTAALAFIAGAILILRGRRKK